MNGMKWGDEIMGGGRIGSAVWGGSEGGGLSLGLGGFWVFGGFLGVWGGIGAFLCWGVLVLGCKVWVILGEIVSVLWWVQFWV